MAEPEELGANNAAEGPTSGSNGVGYLTADCPALAQLNITGTQFPCQNLGQVRSGCHRIMTTGAGNRCWCGRFLAQHHITGTPARMSARCMTYCFSQLPCAREAACAWYLGRAWVGHLHGMCQQGAQGSLCSALVRKDRVMELGHLQAVMPAACSAAAVSALQSLPAVSTLSPVG